MTQSNDLAIGAEAIAESVGIKIYHVYNLHRYGEAPIHNRKGIGLVADPVELKAWILGKHTQDKISEEKRSGINILAG